MLRAGLVLLAAVCMLPACTPVASYERGRLAHPTMDPSTQTGPGRAHLHAVQEGAAGGSATRAGGCGCN
ncbi:MAG TPA: DUF4266 domain-containing protein [Polyangiaceae bacterium]|nr:DUF4266 domain-containing protein [Polyangiaceae bacterium]